MNKLTIALLFMVTLMACKDDKSQTNKLDISVSSNSSKKISKIENFNCESFFNKGDYSSLCFVDSKLPEHVNRGCIYSFTVKGDKQLQEIKIQFTNKNSAALAEMHYNLQMGNYKKGEITDNSEVGDAAFFDVHRTELKSLSRSNKDLHVRHKNIVFKIMVSYQSNSDKPCFYNDKELIAMAKVIISNL